MVRVGNNEICAMGVHNSSSSLVLNRSTDLAWLRHIIPCGIQGVFSRQGKLRLQKWYELRDSKDKKKIIRELTGMILQRKQKMCNFIEYKDMCIVYKRYASLFFCFAVDKTDNELGALEVIHRYVKVLDKYFGSVCELDIIFNFEKGMGSNLNCIKVF